MPGRKCSSCGVVKPESGFYVSRTARDGLQPACKDCNARRAKEYYAANKDRIKVTARAYYDENVARVSAIKLAKGCADCGYRGHPAALDFDHIDGSAKWSRFREGASYAAAFRRSWSWPRIEAEIAKCEVVCANCHRVRTYNRRKQA